METLLHSQRHPSQFLCEAIFNCFVLFELVLDSVYRRICRITCLYWTEVSDRNHYNHCLFHKVVCGLGFTFIDGGYPLPVWDSFKGLSDSARIISTHLPPALSIFRRCPNYFLGIFFPSEITLLFGHGRGDFQVM